MNEYTPNGLKTFGIKTRNLVITGLVDQKQKQPNPIPS